MKRIALYALIISLFFVFAANHGIAEPGPLTPRVIEQDKNDVSPPLHQMTTVQPLAARAEQPATLAPTQQLHEFKTRTGALRSLGAPAPDPVVQAAAGGPAMPSTTVSFEGINNLYGYLPPDTNGDVGPNHYIQWVNVTFAIWNKSGTLLYGPADGNTLWQGFEGPCETTNHGDPIVLYDHLADRWFMSQFALPNYPNGPFYQCIAVSASGDPLGSWHRYQFSFTSMNDYPKFGVWPDGYYMSINQFAAGSGAWAGAGVAAFERDKMLAGQAASMIYFNLYSVNPNFGGLLPADLDGPAPPAGAPNVFMQFDDNGWGAPADSLAVWEFHVDWTTPANSTFGLSGNPNSTLNTAAFDSDLCGYSRNCIPQPAGYALDSIPDRLMYRLQYRNFGDHRAMVVNHTVDAGSDHAGVRWYELRNTGGGWSIYQQGTYAPDADHRWMGSTAMDAAGNIALGYSVSGASTYPSIRYTGRLAGDPLNTMAQGEATLIAGSGYQNHSSGRWGDYSMMAVDPTDDCTFWYTQEYYATSGTAPWQTRIGSFKFPNCTSSATGTLQGTITTTGAAPVGGARVALSNGLSTYSDDAGFYQFASAPTGTYSVTVSAYGYKTKTVTGVVVPENATATKNIWVAPAALVTVQGTVTDGSGHGWPLYARVDIAGYPGGLLYTDPATGHYSVSLYESTSYDFTVSAVSSGYTAVTRTVIPPAGGRTENFALTADSTCSAPGYTQNLKFQDFEASAGGYTASGTTSWAWGAPTSGPGNAHSGSKVWATNLSGYYNNNENGYITSANIDLSANAGQSSVLSWWQWLRTESCCDYSGVEVSNDGGATWSLVYGPVSGSVALAWTERTVILDPTYSVNNFRVRFHFTTDSSVTYDGWYVDDVSVRMNSCKTVAGGLATGFVTDANTGLPLGSAIVATPVKSTGTDTTGYYAFTLSAGSRTITASKAGYANATASINVVSNSVVRTDFNLGAGMLNAGPASVSVVINTNVAHTANRTVTLSNAGTAAAEFELVERPSSPSLPTGLFQKPAFVVKPFKQGLGTAEGLGLPAPPAAPPFAAGDVIQSWPTGLPMSWGIAYDAADDSVWVGSPTAAWNGGTNTLYEYGTNGAQTGRNHPFTWNLLNGPADGTFNPNTGRIWIMDVGTDNCIHEIDPAAGPTGVTICPGFSASQRGLAYDPTTDTYFAGSWNDGMIHHFSSAGVMLNEVYVGLPIAGLAYNPDTQHLFVMTNYSPNSVYVLDAASGFTVIGQFVVPGFGSYSGAGLEIDCSGKLWAVNQQTQTAYQIDSGETANFCVTDIPWLAESPVSGSVAGGGAANITLSFNADALAFGNYQALLAVENNTPYGPVNIPVNLTVIRGKVTLFAPNGGEKIPAGSVRKITWGAVDAAAWFKLQYSRNNGATWTVIADNVTGRSYDWVVPEPGTSQGLVKVTAYNSSGAALGSDMSDAEFIVEVVKIFFPNGNESLLSGTVQYVVWQTFGTASVARVELKFSQDNGTTWSKFYTILENNPGFIPWVIQYARSGSCKIKIEFYDAGGVLLGSDTSDAVFSVNF